MSENDDLVEEPPQKAVADPETYREALDAWMKTQWTDATDLRVHDVDMPRSTGFSNETVFFSTTATGADGLETLPICSCCSLIMRRCSKSLA